LIIGVNTLGPIIWPTETWKWLPRMASSNDPYEVI